MLISIVNMFKKQNLLKNSIKEFNVLERYMDKRKH